MVSGAETPLPRDILVEGGMGDREVFSHEQGHQTYVAVQLKGPAPQRLINSALSSTNDNVW